ncbi:type II toxin-antitoxin system MqsA family antitoxin [Shewanella baltica]|uniref:type II toxin-antitoxin system MqsA family antitoxin n=1 Tax=Shewanella baltica TaxID=62322 RepID=UPI003D7B1907
MKKNSVCVICEEGTLIAKVESTSADYKGHTTTLALHISECDCCGSETSTAEQLRTNKRLMAEFKKQVDGLLTGKQVKEIRTSLGLTQADAAKIFGGGPVAFSKYEADDVTQSDAMDKLLRLVKDIPDVYAYLTHNAQNHDSIVRPVQICNWENLVLPTKAAKKTAKKQQNVRIINSNLLTNEYSWQRQATCL